MAPLTSWQAIDNTNGRRLHVSSLLSLGVSSSPARSLEGFEEGQIDVGATEGGSGVSVGGELPSWKENAGCWEG